MNVTTNIFFYKSYVLVSIHGGNLPPIKMIACFALFLSFKKLTVRIQNDVINITLIATFAEGL